MAKKIVFTTDKNDLEMYINKEGTLTIDIGENEDLQSWRHIELEKADVTELIKSLNELVEKM